MCLPTAETPLSEKICSNPKFYPWFKDAMGAIDGSHLPCFPPLLSKAACRDKDGNITQNLLVACTFEPEMEYCYVLAGWEGSAS